MKLKGGQIPRKQRLNVIMEVFFKFIPKATTNEIYDWAVKNKLKGFSNITKADLGLYLSRSIYIKNIQKKKNRPAIWEWKG